MKSIATCQEAKSAAALGNLCTAVLALCHYIGRPELGAPVMRMEDEPAVDFPQLGVWATHGEEFPVILKSITGDRAVAGYCVGYVKTQNNYPHEPDEAEPVEFLRTTDVYAAAEAVIQLHLRFVVDGMRETVLQG